MAQNNAARLQNQKLVFTGHREFDTDLIHRVIDGINELVNYEERGDAMADAEYLNDRVVVVVEIIRPTDPLN